MAEVYNENGQCATAEEWISREADANAIGDTFKGIMSSIPAFSMFAGLVPDTYTANALLICPGATVDHTDPYSQEYILIGVIVALMVVYLIA